MNVRRRSGLMKSTVGSAPANAVSQRQDADSQVKAVKNAHNKPKPMSYGKIKNAVNG